MSKKSVILAHLSMNIGERMDPIEMAGLFQGDIMLTARDAIPDLVSVFCDILKLMSTLTKISVMFMDYTTF